MGGEGNIGPIESVIEAAPNSVMVVIFEIRDDQTPFVVEPAPYSATQVRIKVNRAVDEKSAVRDFYITNLPLSSSLLKPSPMAMTEDPGYFHCKTWGDNCRIEKTISANITSLADIIDELGLPPPDVISADAQDAELGILKGAGRYLDNVLGVVTEVEFSEIYHKQSLFDEQMALLSPCGLRLVNLFNSQVWHPGPRMRGHGFLTVAEAVFVKYFHAFGAGEEHPSRGYADMRLASTPELVKACTLAMGLRLLSYAVKIADFLKAERSDYQGYVEAVPVLQVAFTLSDYVARNLHLMNGKFDIFVDAIQFPDSHNLKYPVPDTSALQWIETKKRLMQERVEPPAP